jgi:hypothetical protein
MVGMKLRIGGGIIEAFQAGVKVYQPLADVPLSAETGDPETTARNAHALFQSGRTILAVISSGVPHQGVLFVFKTGELFLATGFTLTNCEPLARFLVEHNDGDWTEEYDRMLSHLKAWPTDMAGPIATSFG